MKASVKQARGVAGARAFQVYHRLVFGLNMTPLNAGKKYDEWVREFEAKTDEDKRRDLAVACLLVDLEPEEMHALLALASDPNGNPLGPENVSGLPPNEIVEIMTDVCMELSKIPLYSLTSEQKKN